MRDLLADSLIETSSRSCAVSANDTSQSHVDAGPRQADFSFLRANIRHILLFFAASYVFFAATPATSKTVTGKLGMVATAHPEASKAAAEMLRSGGNAMDAAVVAAYVLSVVEPYSAGIGGGGFLLYRDAKSQQTSVIDYREVAPKRASRDMYIVDGKLDPKKPVEGIFAVAVPGMVPGLYDAQKKFGNKDLAESLDAAIKIAETGFKVLPKFHRTSIYRQKLLQSHPESAKIFLNDGEPYKVGELVIQKDLAKTLRALKTEGPELFRSGWVAKAMVAESERLGGLLEIDDLKQFKTRWRTPISVDYRGYKIETMPLPSSGGTHIVQLLQMLDIDRQKRGRKQYWLDADDIHVLVESMRLAYADRAKHLGDPKFYDSPVDILVSPDYVQKRYSSIELTQAKRSSKVSAGKAGDSEPNETTHLTIIDKDGNVASLTQTINYSWGSGVVASGTGILLNNEMDDFSSAPGAPNSFGLVGGEANSIQPGKIPLSSMSPTIVTKDGKVRLALGSPGGSTIITTVLQTLLHVLDYGLDIGSAINSPRIHHQWLPDELRLEEGALTDGIVKELKARGHIIKHYSGYWGDATGIEILKDGSKRGAADARGDGVVVAE